jgi:hypothetical protein
VNKHSAARRAPTRARLLVAYVHRIEVTGCLLQRILSVDGAATGAAQTDAALISEIRAAHAAARGICGAPRIRIDLAATGIRSLASGEPSGAAQNTRPVPMQPFAPLTFSMT